MERIYLPNSMMVTGILGLIISAYFTAFGTFERWFAGWGENTGTSLGVAFCFVFMVILAASIYSITPSAKDV